MPTIRTFLLALLLSSSIACRCCPSSDSTSCPSDGSPGGPLVPAALGGKAYFVEDGPRETVKLNVSGSFDITGSVTGFKLIAVRIYGGPGAKPIEELACPGNLIHTIPSPPLIWTTPWIEGAWDGTITRYQVLVRYVYSYTEASGGTARRYADYLLGALNFNSSKPVSSSLAPESGGVNSPQVTSSATFDGAQNLALYDIDLTYDNPVDRVKVYTAPAGITLPNEAYLLHDEAYPPSPLRGWHPTALRGYFDGSATYKMYVYVDFHAGNDVPLSGTFATASGQGVLVPLQPL